MHQSSSSDISFPLLIVRKQKKTVIIIIIIIRPRQRSTKGQYKGRKVCGSLLILFSALVNGAAGAAWTL